MRRKGIERKNFFIAKNRDSESTRRAFGGPYSGAMLSIAS